MQQCVRVEKKTFNWINLEINIQFILFHSRAGGWHGVKFMGRGSRVMCSHHMLAIIPSIGLNMSVWAISVDNGHVWTPSVCGNVFMPHLLAWKHRQAPIPSYRIPGIYCIYRERVSEKMMKNILLFYHTHGVARCRNSPFISLYLSLCVCLSLHRRLTVLNKCASMKLEVHFQRKEVGRSEEITNFDLFFQLKTCSFPQLCWWSQPFPEIANAGCIYGPLYNVWFW